MWEELENILRSRATENDKEVLKAALVALGTIAELVDPSQNFYEMVLWSLSSVVGWPVNSQIMSLGLAYNDFVRKLLEREVK